MIRTVVVQANIKDFCEGREIRCPDSGHKNSPELQGTQLKRNIKRRNFFDLAPV